VGGYSPDWFGFAKTLMLGASRFGVDFYQRVMNGKATDADFRNALEFHKSILTRYANQDYVSMNAVTGGVEASGKGLGGIALAGPWGHPRYANNNLTYGQDWEMGPLPGTQTFVYYPNTFMVFAGSKEPEAAVALSFCGFLKDTQTFINPAKGSIPSRTDVDESVFPVVGRYEVAVFSNRYVKQSTSIPRARVGLPAVVAAEYPAPASAYMAGSATLDQAVRQFLEIQRKHQAEFTIQWEF
jgi:ABC-type glycerol-3-phosphate transport system substrate-binding protein